MTDSVVLAIALQTMLVALKLSAPILATSLAIGFAISLFQAMTQIQEFTLSFVPKVIGVGVGERADDLLPFDPETFINSLFQ